MKPYLESFAGILLLLFVSVGTYWFLVSLDDKRKKDLCSNITEYCNAQSQFKEECINNLTKRCLNVRN